MRFVLFCPKCLSVLVPAADGENLDCPRRCVLAIAPEDALIATPMKQGLAEQARKTN